MGGAGSGDELHYSIEYCNFGKEGIAGDWNKQSDMEGLRDFFKSWDPLLNEMLGMIDQAYVLKLADTKTDLNYVSESGKVLLIGDAAHAMLPHSGSVRISASRRI